MPAFRTVAQAALIALGSLNGTLAAAQLPLNDPGQCKPRKGARYSASEKIHTDMYAVLVPARDSADASAIYLATLLQEVQAAHVAPDMRSFRILKATHAEFAASVRAVLPRMRSYPAELNGCPVRQIVQLPFAFKLSWEWAVPS